MWLLVVVVDTCQAGAQMLLLLLFCFQLLILWSSDVAFVVVVLPTFHKLELKCWFVVGLSLLHEWGAVPGD